MSAFSVVRVSFASFDATIRSKAFLDSAWINALSSCGGAMTKQAFSNWLLDLVLPPEVSRASISSAEEQFRMAESEGALNLMVSTRESESISTGLACLPNPCKPMTLFSGRRRVPPKSFKLWMKMTFPSSLDH